MANLKEVRNRIQSIKSTQQITKAMKMVAAAKLRKAQDSILQMRPYAQRLGMIVEHLAANASWESQSIYALERDQVDNALLIVITSDRGLCGAFNSNAIKAALTRIEQNYSDLQATGNLWIMPIGKKAWDFFRVRGYQLVEDYVDVMHHLSFQRVREAAEFALEGFATGNFDQVDLVYNEFRNVATQVIRVEQYLPIVLTKAETPSRPISFILEPSIEYIQLELIPLTLKFQFYKAALESNASEHGARMTAMNQATDNAGELLKELRLVYNRTRQAAITKEILEIVGGAEALAGG
jgi:F-type H+-transporting ATPase subunit gamma